MSDDESYSRWGSGGDLTPDIPFAKAYQQMILAQREGEEDDMGVDEEELDLPLLRRSGMPTGASGDSLEGAKVASPSQIMAAGLIGSDGYEGLVDVTTSMLTRGSDGESPRFGLGVRGGSADALDPTSLLRASDVVGLGSGDAETKMLVNWQNSSSLDRQPVGSAAEVAPAVSARSGSFMPSSMRQTSGPSVLAQATWLLEQVLDDVGTLGGEIRAAARETREQARLAQLPPVELRIERILSWIRDLSHELHLAFNTHVMSLPDLVAWHRLRADMYRQARLLRVMRAEFVVMCMGRRTPALLAQMQSLIVAEQPQATVGFKSKVMPQPFTLTVLTGVFDAFKPTGKLRGEISTELSDTASQTPFRGLVGASPPLPPRTSPVDVAGQDPPSVRNNSEVAATVPVYADPIVAALTRARGANDLWAPIGMGGGGLGGYVSSSVSSSYMGEASIGSAAASAWPKDKEPKKQLSDAIRSFENTRSAEMQPRFLFGTRKMVGYLRFHLQGQLTVGGEVHSVSLTSEDSQPVVVITHESQWAEAELQLIKLEAFGVGNETTWPRVGNILHMRFLLASRQKPEAPGRTLAEQDLDYFHERFFERAPIVTLEALTVFWRWLGRNLHVIRYGRNVGAMWRKGLLYGFLSKDAVTAALSQREVGTFLVRFSENNPGTFAVCYRHGDAVKHYLVKQLDAFGDKKSLADFLLFCPQFVYILKLDDHPTAGTVLVPYPKEHVLGDLVSNREGRDTPGYEDLPIVG